MYANIAIVKKAAMLKGVKFERKGTIVGQPAYEVNGKHLPKSLIVKLYLQGDLF